MIDQSLPWCTYKTTHISGFYYYGKAKTAKVLDGTYKGSGLRFKLSQHVPGFESSTWTTQLFGTFNTESDAYSAEEILVPIALLADPYCLNMNAGGQVGKYRNHSSLMKSITSEQKAVNRKIKLDKQRAKKQEQIDTIKKLKQQLGKTNGNIK